MSLSFWIVLLPVLFICVLPGTAISYLWLRHKQKDTSFLAAGFTLMEDKESPVLLKLLVLCLNFGLFGAFVFLVAVFG